MTKRVRQIAEKYCQDLGFFIKKDKEDQKAKLAHPNKNLRAKPKNRRRFLLKKALELFDRQAKPDLGRCVEEFKMPGQQILQDLQELDKSPGHVFTEDTAQVAEDKCQEFENLLPSRFSDADFEKATRRFKKFTGLEPLPPYLARSQWKRRYYNYLMDINGLWEKIGRCLETGDFTNAALWIRIFLFYRRGLTTKAAVERRKGLLGFGECKSCGEDLLKTNKLKTFCSSKCKDAFHNQDKKASKRQLRELQLVSPP